MKKFYLATAFLFLALSSLSLSPTFALVPSSSALSSQIFTEINTDYLCQDWVHSREEQKPNDKAEIYRPKNSREFPASRFRMAYGFDNSGNCQWFFLAPDDGHYFKSGRWSIDSNDKTLLRITKDNRTEVYKVTELTKDILRMVQVQ